VTGGDGFRGRLARLLRARAFNERSESDGGGAHGPDLVIESGRCAKGVGRTTEGSEFSEVPTGAEVGSEACQDLTLLAAWSILDSGDVTPLPSRRDPAALESGRCAKGVDERPKGVSFPRTAKRAEVGSEACQDPNPLISLFPMVHS
jgi:hypothetical protein